MDAVARTALLESLKLESKDANDAVKAMRAEFDLRSEHLLKDVMPAKVVYLQSVFEKYRLDRFDDQLRDSTDLPPSSSVAVPVNPSIQQLLEVVQTEIVELLSIVDTLRMWVLLNIPTIEDGNNFGVAIQEEVVELLRGGKMAGLSVLEASTKYFASRGKLISKARKYPRIKDYMACVRELDDKQRMMLTNCCLDLRNNYAILYDMINKNIRRIKQPKGRNNGKQTMY